MYESTSKNNELENEMTMDISYFWHSDGGMRLFPSWNWTMPICLCISMCTKEDPCLSGIIQKNRAITCKYQCLTVEFLHQIRCIQREMTVTNCIAEY